MQESGTNQTFSCFSYEVMAQQLKTGTGNRSFIAHGSVIQ